MNLARMTDIYKLQQLARRRVPKIFYDYVDTGSWTESTYRDNSAAFSHVRLRQRVARNISERSLASSIAGQAATMPVALAPVGMAGLQHADGEICAARAAESFGVPFTLSTMSICSMEAVAAATSSPFWFQLYVMRDRGFAANLIERAKSAGCSALVLTLDLPLAGQRHKDIENGLGTPARITAPAILDMMRHPRWCLDMLRTKNRTFGNIIGHVSGVNDMASFAEWTGTQMDQTLDWATVDWVRKKWGGALILKGINDVDDARIAVKTGADAIVVSNHGGRQLDGAPATIETLPTIVDTIDGQLEVYLDSGIRSGQDVLKALALGAKAAFVGRAYIYGLGAAGQAGVTRALEIIRNELDTTLALCGETSVDALGSHNIWR